MNDLELTRTLQDSQSAVFTTQQLAVILNMSSELVAVKLNRLVNRGVLIRLKRGLYTLPSTDVLAVASGIYQPSYVSLLSAFDYYGTTTQTPRIIDVINPVRSGKMPLELDAGQYSARFIKVKPSSVTGYKRIYINGIAAQIAEKEKAIIDALIFMNYVPLDETVACIRSGIDSKRIVELAMQTEKQSVMKRLGYILSMNGIDCDFGMLSETYVPLDPSLPNRGKHDSKWHVIINRVIE